MKKIAITIIILGLIGCGVSYYISSTNSSNIENSTNTLTTSNNYSNNKLHTSTSVDTNNSATSKNGANDSYLEEAKAINMANNSNLNFLMEVYLNKFYELSIKINNVSKENIQSQEEMDKASAYAYNSWNITKNKLVTTINGFLTPNESNLLNSEENLFYNYMNQEVTNAGNTHAGGGLEPDIEALMGSSILEDRSYFLAYNYLDNTGVNPQLSASFGNHYISQLSGLTSKQQALVDKYMSEFTSIEHNCNTIINNAKNNKTSMVIAYNQVYNIWTNELNSLYQYLKSNLHTYEPINSFDIPWLNYKDKMVSIVGQSYSNPIESKLAQSKMAIRLTQCQCYNLLSNYAAAIGISW